MTAMPHTSPDLRDDAPDDFIEQLLVDDARDHRDDYLHDTGFTARVMSALPAPAPAALPRWRKPVLTSLWASAGLGLAFALPGTVLDVARGTFGLLAGRSFSLYEVASIIVVLGLATWTGTAVARKRV